MADEPQQKKTLPWKWNAAKHEAAQLLAADELTDQEISDKVDVRRSTLWGWKQRPEFAAEVARVVELLGEVAARYAVTRRSRRLQGYERRREGMLRVIDERAEDPDMAAAAGGKTGLLVRTIRSVGSGPNAREVEEFAVDTALLKELRELEKQAAVEAGQWTDKREHSIVGLDTAIERELARLAGGGQAAAPGATPGGDALPAGAVSFRPGPPLPGERPDA